MSEIRELIAFYDERGWDWSMAVAYVAMRQQFGGWKELCDSIRRPWPNAWDAGTAEGRGQ